MKYSCYRSIDFLRKHKKQFSGRNQQGHITVRHRGGGHKQAFRQINWNRDQFKSIVVGFEFDPNRNAILAKLFHSKYDSDLSFKSKDTYSYILASTNMQLFQEVHSYGLKSGVIELSKLIQPGDKAPIGFFEPGDFIHSVSSFAGYQAVFSRAAGTFCQIIARSNDNKVISQNYSKVRLPSGSQRYINCAAQATFGIVASSKGKNYDIKKAGRNRWLGWRPTVRGVAINPVDHPHGGGQGKTSGGRPSVTFKSWPTKGQPTRNPKRRNKFIL